MELKFRDLKANEIKVRVQQCKKTKTGKVYADYLLYKDARCDQSILDETVGEFNWQRDHKEIKSNVYCGVSIWDDSKQQWITKWDCGTESNTEAEKGEASDSFKRACFNWGIGRELYTSPSIRLWLNEEDYYIDDKSNKYVPIISLKVKNIAIINKQINSLTIVDADNHVRFGWSIKSDIPQEEVKPKEEVKKKQKLSDSVLQDVKELNMKLELIATYHKCSVEDLTDNQVKQCIILQREALKKRGSKANA